MIDWSKVNLPSGVSSDVMWGDLLNIASLKARHHANLNKFWFTKEDLEQEIIIKFIKALYKFNPTKAYHQKYALYFSRCADNIVADLKRKHLYYHKLPCKTCPHWIKENSKRGEHDCKKYLNKDSCDLYERYLDLYKSKYTLGCTYGNYTADKPSLNDGDSSSEVSGYIHSMSGSSSTQYLEDVFENIDLDDFLEKRLTDQSYLTFKALINYNYDVKKINESEFDLLKIELFNIYKLKEDKDG